MRALPPEREDRAMPSGENQLLSILSKDDFALLEPHLEPVTLGLRKYLERPNRRITAVYFPEGGIRIRRRHSIQRQAGRGWIDRPRGHDRPAGRARRSPLAQCDLHADVRNRQVHVRRVVARRVPGQRITSRLVVEIRAGVRGANDEHRDLQRTVQTGRATGALALDGARPGGRRIRSRSPTSSSRSCSASAGPA